MQYNVHIEQSSQILAAAADAETDYLIQYFVRIQRLGDKVRLAFDYDNIACVAEFDGAKLELLSEGFEVALREIEREFPGEVWENCKSSLTTN